MSIMSAAAGKMPRNVATALEFIAPRRRLVAERCEVTPAKHGLEISPLFAQLVVRGEAQMVYCDRLSTEDLQSREKDNQGRIGLKCEVEEMDFVWKDGTLLPAYFGDDEKFDFVVSSHVMEHVPNFLGFLAQQFQICKDDGVVCFVVPDVKLTGKYFQPLTTPAQLIDVLLVNRDKPSPGMVYEATYHIFEWPGLENLRAKHVLETQRGYTTAQAAEFARVAVERYIDVHCWSFTYSTFEDVFAEVRDAGFLDFEIVAIDQIAAEIVCTLKPNRARSGSRMQALRHEIKELESRLTHLKSQLQASAF
jgi:SAM-dependent methyltransferase